MAHKIVQLEMFREDKKTFEELMLSTTKALFATLSSRNKAMDIVVGQVKALEEIVIRMDDRINRMSEK